MIKMGGPLLAVHDAAVSKKFYMEVMGLTPMMDLGVHVAFKEGLSIQENFAELIGIDGETVSYKPNNIEIYFEVEDLEEWEKKLQKSSAEFIHNCREYPWGQRVFRFYDPDMHIIEIGESMEIVIKRFLALGLSAEQVAEKSMFLIAFVKSCME